VLEGGRESHPLVSGVEEEPPRILKVTGTMISFHCPGFHLHCFTALIAEWSSVAKPEDSSNLTPVTRPVAKSSATIKITLPS
jgi:hypothetical protein